VHTARKAPVNGVRASEKTETAQYQKATSCARTAKNQNLLTGTPKTG
jgi:hypothetical protein